MNLDEMVDDAYVKDVRKLIEDMKCARRNALLDILDEYEVNDYQKVSDQVTCTMGIERIMVTDEVIIPDVIKRLKDAEKKLLTKYLIELDPVDYQKVCDEVTEAIHMENMKFESPSQEKKKVSCFCFKD